MLTAELAQRQRLRLTSRTRGGVLPGVLGKGVSVLDGIFGDGTVVVCAAAPLQRDALLRFVHHSQPPRGSRRTWQERKSEK